MTVVQSPFFLTHHFLLTSRSHLSLISRLSESTRARPTPLCLRHLSIPSLARVATLALLRNHTTLFDALPPQKLPKVSPLCDRHSCSADPFCRTLSQWHRLQEVSVTNRSAPIVVRMIVNLDVYSPDLLTTTRLSLQTFIQVASPPGGVSD